MALLTLLATLALTPFCNAFVPPAPPSIIHAPIPQTDRTEVHQQLRFRDATARPNLAMAIDTTGSMGQYIRALRTEVRRIVTGSLGSTDAPPLLVLSPFHDPSTGPVTSTPDPIDFLAALDTLSASGGGDCPELSLAGALAALNRLETGGTLIVVTDASAKDAERKEEVIAAARLKHVKVLFFLFDNICGTGEPAYGEIATATGGQIFTGLTVEDATKVTALVDVLLKSNLVDFLRVEPEPSAALLNLTGVPLNLTGLPAGRYSAPREVITGRALAKRAFLSTTVFVIDPSMSSVVLSVDGGREVTVTRPDGTVVQATDAGAQLLALSRGVVLILTAPIPGFWTVAINDCEACSVSVSGTASVFFDSFSLTIGRDGPPEQRPVGQCAYWAVVTTIGEVATVFVEFRRASGALISYARLTQGTPGTRAFYGEVTIPSEPFVVYLRAYNSDGFESLRVLPSLLEPATGACPGVTGPEESSTTSTTSSTSSTSSSSTTAPPVSDTSSVSVGVTASANGTVTSTSSAIEATLISASIRPTSTIVETKFIFAQCGKKACADPTTTRTWDPCPDPPCRLQTPAPVLVVAPCGKPACVQQHDGPDTVTTVVVDWTTTCPSVETVVSGTITLLRTRIATITKAVTIQSIIPCVTCHGPNYPGTPPHATATEVRIPPPANTHAIPPPVGVPAVPGPGSNATACSPPGCVTPGVVLTAAAPRMGESWTVKDIMLVQMYTLVLAFLLW
ncbi:hypothetical protein B0T16DRAFT_402982 [Cercophora newfieldiana]|uniref:Hemicentin-1-like von Willebrand factor A domain-containing protein n=1 Tax=Cercophora newfieldiana TaxID=92897 RepID=A0AA40D1A4_9PEZI|nr:hypothetical protein B0T16DRAFT_402982 [Cercophora newfieldiana]